MCAGVCEEMWVDTCVDVCSDMCVCMCIDAGRIHELRSDQGPSTHIWPGFINSHLARIHENAQVAVGSSTSAYTWLPSCLHICLRTCVDACLSLVDRHVGATCLHTRQVGVGAVVFNHDGKVCVRMRARACLHACVSACMCACMVVCACP